jgi:hypothetical protein
MRLAHCKACGAKRTLLLLDFDPEPAFRWSRCRNPRCATHEPLPLITVPSTHKPAQKRPPATAPALLEPDLARWQQTMRQRNRQWAERARQRQRRAR